MSVQTHLRHAEAWAQAELGAQKRLLALLGEQERATLENDTTALQESTEQLDRELAGEPARARLRRQLAEGLGAEWGVDARALTIRSIAERAGDAGERLRALRDELREVAGEVSAAGRRLAALARLHRGVYADLIGVLAGPGSDGTGSEEGLLVRAEA
jgi:chromosome segregation ATPase